MSHWLPHVQCSLAPLSDRCDALRRLHLKQVFAAAPDAEVVASFFSLLVRVALKIRSLRLHNHRFCQFAVFSLQTNLPLIAQVPWIPQPDAVSNCGAIQASGRV